MSREKDNRVDWTAAATPVSGGIISGASRKSNRRETPQTRRNVMDTLLGDTNLSAFDAGGNDPYNATGRQFRR